MAEGGLICVIVPGVENPFFGAMQQIAADKAEELGYTHQTASSTTTTPSLQAELFETCVAQGALAIILDNAGADASVAAVQLGRRRGRPQLPRRPRDHAGRRGRGPDRLQQLPGRHHPRRVLRPS